MEKFVFFNESENKEPKFDDVTYFSEGLCAVRIGNGWGYIDKTGNIVINPRFEEAGGFSNGFAEAGENYKIGIVDKNGNYLIEPMFDIKDTNRTVEASTGKIISYCDSVISLLFK